MFDWKITPGVVFHTIQSRLCKKNDPMAGTLALMLADYLRDRHRTCTLHCGDTLCLIACPICCERETRRDTYAYIQITDWVSCMAYPFSLLRLLFCIEVGLIVIYTQYTKHWWNLPFLFFQILFKIEENFYKIPWFLFTIADKSKDVSIIYFLH